MANRRVLLSAQGGAAQPASSPGGAEQPIVSEVPDDAFELTVAFYNVGLQASQVNSKKWPDREAKLANDIINAAKNHKLDILCLCELGEINVGIGGKLSQSVSAWIHGLFSGSEVWPFEVYESGHYATLRLSTRITICDYQVVNRFVGTQQGRCFQHFRVCSDKCDVPISIVNCHAPSSQTKKLTKFMREQYFTAFHKACGDDPFIWGGDFNTEVANIECRLWHIDARYRSTWRGEQPGVKYVLSHQFRQRHGDVALTFGLETGQVDSGIGVSKGGASDAHDVVVVKAFRVPSRPAKIPRKEPAGSAVLQPSQQSSELHRAELPKCPMPTRTVPRPETAAVSASSAAHPALQKPADSAVQPSPLQSSAVHKADQPMWEMPTRPPPQTEAEFSSSNNTAETVQQEPAGIAETQTSSTSSAAQFPRQDLASSALPSTPTTDQKRWGNSKSLASQQETAAKRPEPWPMHSLTALRTETEVSSAGSTAQSARQESAGSAVLQPPQQFSEVLVAESLKRPMSTRPAPQTKPEASSAGSAAKLARQELASSAMQQLSQQSSEQQKCAMPTRSAPQPETEDSSAGITGQPAQQEPVGSAVQQPPQQCSALHDAEQLKCAMPTLPAPQTETEASSADSTAQPVRQEPAGIAMSQSPHQSSALDGAEQLELAMPTCPTDQSETEASSESSAAQPAQQEPAANAQAEARSASSPAQSASQEPHPRVNAIFGTDETRMEPLKELLEEIGKEFLQDKVRNILVSKTGCYDMARPLRIIDRLEAFLKIVEEMRARHLRNHPNLKFDEEFSLKDMQEIHHEWMEDHENWINLTVLRGSALEGIYNCKIMAFFVFLTSSAVSRRLAFSGI